MRTSVPMCGSTASNRVGWAAEARVANKTTAQLLVMLQAAVPVAEHLIGARDLRRTHEAKAQPLRVGVVPDALRQLGVLLFPVGSRRRTRRAGHGRRRVVPGSAAHGV